MSPFLADSNNFSEDFEDDTLGIMTTIDADGDGHNWMNSSELQAQGDGHNGSARYAYSESWSSALNRWGLNPDNFLVSPLVAIGSRLHDAEDCEIIRNYQETLHATSLKQKKLTVSLGWR